jgi:hypothetical protein
MGNVTQTSFQAAVTALTAADANVEAKRIELTQLQDARDDQIKALIDLTTRARAGVKSTFGPDSAQYDQAGAWRATTCRWLVGMALARARVNANPAPAKRNQRKLVARRSPL